MISNYLVSVIVPIYNVEKYLDRCIDSIVKQSYENIEILLVDDGATDLSGKLADDWGKRDSRIRVIHQKNAGLSEARNVGIDAAKGDYIVFVDSDDWIHKRMIEALVKHLMYADIVRCGMVKVTDAEQLELPWVDEERVLSSGKATALLVDNNWFSSHVQTSIYPKYVFETIKFPKGKVYEDILTTHKLFTQVKKICVIPEHYYYYYERSESITNSVKLQNRIAWYDALGKRKYDLGNALTLDEKQKIESQMAVVMSLAMVQYKFTNEEKKLCAEEIEKIMCFLRKKETWKSVKRYATKTQFIYYILARRFSFSANYLYRIIRGS